MAKLSEIPVDPVLKKIIASNEELKVLNGYVSERNNNIIIIHPTRETSFAIEIKAKNVVEVFSSDNGSVTILVQQDAEITTIFKNKIKISDLDNDSLGDCDCSKNEIVPFKDDSPAGRAQVQCHLRCWRIGALLSKLGFPDRVAWAAYSGCRAACFRVPEVHTHDRGMS